MDENVKPVIYQLLPRLFTNTVEQCVPNGTIEQNGCGKMNQITPTVLRSIKDLGATHVWYTGVIEHAHCTDYTVYGIERDNPHVVKGKAGSPYAISDYYDIDPDIAEQVEKRVHEFEQLVKRTHKAGLKVVMDFVPNHVARRYKSDAKPIGIKDFGADDDTDMFFSPNNNFYYMTRQQFAPSIDLGSGADAYVEFPAKATGNDCFTAFPGRNDWYETVKLNYGIDYGNYTRYFDPKPNTWFKMLNILRYWAAKGVDAFRCDMAHMVPLEFWQWAIAKVKERYPDIKFIAEIYDVALYRPYIQIGGFDYLYDKVTLYDTLRGIQAGNLSAAQITSCWQTVDGISHHMLNFLENHDEQRFASEFYAGNAALVTPSLVVSSMISTAPFMVYMGQELGEPAAEAEGFSGADGRTTIFDYWSIDTLRRWYNGGKCDGERLTAAETWLRSRYRSVLRLLNTEPAIAFGKFFDLMYVNYHNPAFNPHRQFAFLRHHGSDTLLIVANFGDQPAQVGVNIPDHAFEYLGIQSGTYSAEELLTGRRQDADVDPDKQFMTEVGPYDAVIWKLTGCKVKEDSKKSRTKTAHNAKK